MAHLAEPLDELAQVWPSLALPARSLEDRSQVRAPLCGNLLAADDDRDRGGVRLAEASPRPQGIGEA